MIKCCFCGKDCGKYGNNAMPVKDDRCCDECNERIVVPARLRCLSKSNKFTKTRKRGVGEGLAIPNIPTPLKFKAKLLPWLIKIEERMKEYVENGSDVEIGIVEQFIEPILEYGREEEKRIRRCLEEKHE